MDQDSINKPVAKSPFHKLNPVTNLILIICIFVLLIIFSYYIFSIILLVFIFLMYGISGIELTLIIKKARFLVYFSVFIFIIQALFTPGEVVLFKPIPDSSPILPGFIEITTDGLALGLSMTLRFLVIVLASFWFVAITDPNRLAYSLMQLGLPYRYGFMLVTSLRFLPQFEIESNTVHNAQLARGIKLEKHGFRGLYNHVRYTLRPLIISALQKAEVLARSMEGRGFGLYNERTFIDKAEFTKKDLAIVGTSLVITVLLIVSVMVVFNQNEVLEFLISIKN